jgi:hypothetical protein
MEIWQILVICILMLPLFFGLNYIVVKSAAKNKRERDDRIERAVAASLQSGAKPKNKYRRNRRK